MEDFYTRPFNPINPVSFRLAELAGLREMARRVRE